MAKKPTGHIQQLPSGSLRDKVYCGTDPVSPARSGSYARPDPTTRPLSGLLARLVKQADGHLAPERDTAFGRVLDLYLEVTELAPTTRVTRESYLRRIIPARAWRSQGAQDRPGLA